jgi:hypothetical protein
MAAAVARNKYVRRFRARPSYAAAWWWCRATILPLAFNAEANIVASAGRMSHRASGRMAQVFLGRKGALLHTRGRATTRRRLLPEAHESERCVACRTLFGCGRQDAGAPPGRLQPAGRGASPPGRPGRRRSMFARVHSHRRGETLQSGGGTRPVLPRDHSHPRGARVASPLARSPADAFTLEKGGRRSRRAGAVTRRPGRACVRRSRWRASRCTRCGRLRGGRGARRRGRR